MKSISLPVYRLSNTNGSQGRDPLFGVYPQIIDFGSGRGRYEIETAGVAALRWGLQLKENDGMDQYQTLTEKAKNGFETRDLPGDFYSLTMTQVSAAGGALTWMIIEAFAYRKVTSLGFVSGILADLVVITPAAGVVQPTVALILGALFSIACYLTLNVKMKVGYDDSLDGFGIHGVGSGLGMLLLSFFIRDSWMAAAGERIPGWTVWNQLAVQLKAMGATIALAAIGTLVICVLIEKTLGFRIDEQGEFDGLDKSLHSKNGYGLIFPEAR